MQLSLQPSPKPIDLIPERKRDAAFPVLLEFHSPSAAIVATPVPRSARGTIWIVTSLFFACLVPMGLIPIDRVVTAQGKVLSQSATIVVQPLETAIVRSIGVREGQTVHAGDILARLDPTFAAADVGALQEDHTTGATRNYLGGSRNAQSIAGRPTRRIANTILATPG